MTAVLVIVGLVLFVLGCVAAVCDRTPDTRRYPDRPSTTVRVVPRIYDWQRTGEW